MHEFGQAQSILKIVLDHARRSEAARVLRVHILKGELNDCVEETLQFLFHALADGTEAADAKLMITSQPIRLRCSACLEEFSVEREYLVARCPRCDSSRIEWISGREFYVESIEVE